MAAFIAAVYESANSVSNLKRMSELPEQPVAPVRLPDFPAMGHAGLGAGAGDGN